MTLTTYSENMQTNLDKSTEAYRWLQEINELLGEEKYFVTVTDVIDRTLFNRNRKVGEYYSIYYRIDKYEFQQIHWMKSLNYQAVESYLLGILTGFDLMKKGLLK